MTLVHSAAIEVRHVRGKGRGVFARRAIAEGEVIERVPVVLLAADEIRDRDGWIGLASYCFLWDTGRYALALGYGSLYNHSYQPNARYDDTGRMTKIFTALRDIAPGEEITVNYNGDPEDLSPVGFKVLEETAPQQAQ
ncbi:MAG: SET domain-containing protein [Isosphaeraceae bacterium]|nr:SET domain-containing protein [Isosphaeraceae bacterium]